MKIVTAEEPGMNIKLHSLAEKHSYWEVLEDGSHLTIAKGQIVRIDSPSQQLNNALRDMLYQSNIPPHPLLITTEEAPTQRSNLRGGELVSVDPVTQQRELISQMLASMPKPNRDDIFEELAGKFGVKVMPAEANSATGEVKTEDGRILVMEVPNPPLDEKPPEHTQEGAEALRQAVIQSAIESGQLTPEQAESAIAPVKKKASK